MFDAKEKEKVYRLERKLQGPELAVFQLLKQRRRYMVHGKVRERICDFFDHATLPQFWRLVLWLHDVGSKNPQNMIQLLGLEEWIAIKKIV